MAAGSMDGPGKTPARARAVCGKVIGAALDAALGDFRRHVVKGHTPAKYPVRHGDDDIAGALGLPRVHRRLQDRVDGGVAADPPASSCLRDSRFSDSPSRRAGFSMTRTFKPRCLAAITAFKSDGSEKRNILTRRDFVELFMASSIGLAESSGITIKERDIHPPCDLSHTRHQTPSYDAVPSGYRSTRGPKTVKRDRLSALSPGLFRSTQPGMLPSCRDVLVASAKLDVGTGLARENNSTAFANLRVLPHASGRPRVSRPGRLSSAGRSHASLSAGNFRRPPGAINAS